MAANCSSSARIDRIVRLEAGFQKKKKNVLIQMF